MIVHTDEDSFVFSHSLLLWHADHVKMKNAGGVKEEEPWNVSEAKDTTLMERFLSLLSHSFFLVSAHGNGSMRGWIRRMPREEDDVRGPFGLHLHAAPPSAIEEESKKEAKPG